MSTFVKSNTFANGVDSDANTVNQNFDEIADFLNNNAVHVDGSKTMTGVLVLPATDPTSDNQATRKAYVDKCVTDNVTAEANARTAADNNEANTRSTNDGTLQTWINDEVTNRNNADVEIRTHYNGGTFTVTSDGNGNFSYFYPRVMAGNGAGVAITSVNASLTFIVFSSNNNAFSATMCNPNNGAPLPNRTEVLRYVAILS